MAPCLCSIFDLIICDLIFGFTRALLYSLMFPNDSKKNRKSIVRTIGTLLPLPKAPRVYINLAAWRRTVPGGDSSCDATPMESEAESDNENNPPKAENYMKAVQLNNNLQADKEGDVKDLQGELQELKKRIASILESQQRSTESSPSKSVGETIAKSSPPPLSFKPLSPKHNNQSMEGVNTPNRNIHHQINRASSLKESSTFSDPEEMLGQVLKKRFSTTQL